MGEHIPNNNEHLFEMIEIYKDNNIAKSRKAELAFAIGKAHDDCKDFSNALN